MLSMFGRRPYETKEKPGTMTKSIPDKSLLKPKKSHIKPTKVLFKPSKPFHALRLREP